MNDLNIRIISKIIVNKIFFYNLNLIFNFDNFTKKK